MKLKRPVLPAPILFLRETIFLSHSSLLIVNFFAHGLGFSAAWATFMMAARAAQAAIRQAELVGTE
jgi:hypothetical protein